MKSKISPVISSFGKISQEKVFNFLKPYPLFFGLSILVASFFVFNICTKDFHYGTDFRGGLEVRVSFEKEIVSHELQQSLKKVGLTAEIERILSAENTFILRFSTKTSAGEGEVFSAADVEKSFKDFIQSYTPKATIEQTRMVSGVVSDSNKRNAISTLLAVIVLISFYLTLRFEFRYALGALVAVLHDVIIMLGFVSVADLEVNVLTMVAVLTVFGYSVNDTIIVYDRIRELQNKNPDIPFLNTMIYAVRFVIVRTVITSLTTLFVVLSLFFSTAGEYRDFAGLLMVGIVSGTYSSIYIALPFLLIYQKIILLLRKFFVRKR